MEEISSLILFTMSQFATFSASRVAPAPSKILLTDCRVSLIIDFFGFGEQICALKVFISADSSFTLSPELLIFLIMMSSFPISSLSWLTYSSVA